MHKVWASYPGVNTYEQAILVLSHTHINICQCQLYFLKLFSYCDKVMQLSSNLLNVKCF